MFLLKCLCQMARDIPGQYFRTDADYQKYSIDAKYSGVCARRSVKSSSSVFPARAAGIRAAYRRGGVHRGARRASFNCE